MVEHNRSRLSRFRETVDKHIEAEHSDENKTKLVEKNIEKESKENIKDEEMSGFWSLVKKSFSWAWKWVCKNPLFIVLSIFVIAAGVFIKMGGGRFNIGGILGKLFGLGGDSKDPVALGNSVPDGRVDDKGKLIPVGVEDKHGFTQWEQKEIEKSINPLRDTSIIKIKEDDGNEVKIKLPVGIEDNDVDLVIRVKPETYVIKISDDSPVQVGAASLQ